MAAIEGMLSARGMGIANPVHMVKNAWYFADLMMEYRGGKEAYDEGDEVTLIGENLSEEDDEEKENRGE
jgi:hypothetical protein